ncbi:MAG TPA: hypothetical protein VFC54_05895 [Pseudolabrys sp.]|nr:hypothetical protein [Pseudolabrys sp.]
MDKPPLPVTRVCFRRRRKLVFAAFLALTAASLAGCGVNGDFGMVNRDLVRDDIHDWVGRDEAPGLPVSRKNLNLSDQVDFQLTDDERQLRDLAYPLLEPPYNRQKYHSVASEYGLTPQTLRESADRTAYFAHLIAADDRSPSARYARLIDDIRNDTTRLPEFFMTAGRVLDLDRKRLRSLAVVSSSSAAERAQAHARVRENARIISMVRTSLTRRSASYHFALERLTIMSPMPIAGEADHVLTQLNAAIAQDQHGTPPSWSREPSLANAR